MRSQIPPISLEINMIRKPIAAAAIVAGCLFAAPLSADDFQPIPNSVKYKVSGIPNARGRSGSASIEARALLNKDNTANVELTTGSFDPASTNGTLERVLVKQANGPAINLNGTNVPTVSASISGLAHREALQIQADVTGVDGARTDVVSVSEIVKLRPDLKFISVQAQPSGITGLPITVKAVVQETNTDTGARANCVLFADGVEVDRAAGIWVDAGGSVTCEFSPSFSSAGRKALKVVLDSVAPGDYDLANNSIESATTIHDPLEQFNEWTASARDENFRNDFRNSGPGFESVGSTDGWTTTSAFTANQRGEILDVPNLRLTFRLISDGQTIEEVVDAPFPPFRSRDPFSRPCGRLSISSTRATVCAKQFPPEFHTPSYTQLSVGTNGGAVTFYSAQWQHWFDENGQEQFYTWNSTDHSETGMQARFGSTVAMDVSVTDGLRTLFAQPYMQMTPYEEHSEQINCYPDGWCDEVRMSRHGVFGSDAGGL